VHFFFSPFLFDGGRSIGQAPRGDRLVRGGGSWTVESRRTRLRSDADRLYVRRAINLGLFMDGSTVFLVSVDESNSLEYTLWLRPAIAFAAFMQLACMHRFPRAPAVRTNLVTPCLILAEGSATRDSPMFQRYNQRLRFGFKPTYSCRLSTRVEGASTSDPWLHTRTRVNLGNRGRCVVS
jgi:hypothetical protein